MLQADDNSYFQLFPGNIPVNGSNGSIICDVINGNYFQVPDILGSVLKVNCSRNYSIGELKLHFNNQYNQGIDQYIHLFTEKEIGYITRNPEFHGNLVLDYDTPGEVLNAIIEIEDPEEYFLEDILKELENLGCKEVEFRIYNTAGFEKCIEVLERFNESSYRSFIVVVQFEDQINDQNLMEILNRNSKILEIFICESSGNKVPTNDRIKYIRCNHSLGSSVTSFIINLPFFAESQEYNASLNKKICISKKGYIKTYPSHLKDYGNVREQSIGHILKTTDISDVWLIPNNQIEICKDCKYRYICLNFSDIHKKENTYLKTDYCDELWKK